MTDNDTPSGAGREPDIASTGSTDPTASLLLRLRTCSDVAAAVPFLLGFVPQDSLVVVALADGEIRLTARLDLPSPEGPDQGQAVQAEAVQLAEDLAAPLTFVQAQGVAVIGYGPPAVDPLVTAFAAGLGLPVLHLLRVTDGRCWPLGVEPPDCCPPGTPVPDDLLFVTAPAAAAAARAGADPLAPVSPDRLAVQDQVAAELRALDGQPLRVRWLYGLLVQAHQARAEGRRPLAIPQAAGLLHGLHDVTVRDACLLWNDPAALNLWLDLLVMAPVDRAAPAATLLGWTAYRRGNTALATAAMHRALASNPAYSLAQLLARAIVLAVPPGLVNDLLAEALREVDVLRDLARDDD